MISVNIFDSARKQTAQDKLVCQNNVAAKIKTKNLTITTTAAMKVVKAAARILGLIWVSAKCERCLRLTFPLYMV